MVVEIIITLRCFSQEFRQAGTLTVNSLGDRQARDQLRQI
jgi:hypothetical protein